MQQENNNMQDFTAMILGLIIGIGTIIIGLYLAS